MRLPFDAPLPLLPGVQLLAWCARVTRWGFARLWVRDALAELDLSDRPADWRDLDGRIAAAARANGRAAYETSHAAWMIHVDRSLLELPIPEDWHTTGDQLADILTACWVAWIEAQLYDLADICGWWPDEVPA